jgi:5-oxoprolinase (ATP-hydrolysing) subunit C
MNPRLRVERPGLASSIQDLGRLGLQRYGVPLSGVLDPLAARLANALVGNDLGEAVLEMLALGPALVVEAESLRLAVVGSIAGLQVDGVALPGGRSVLAKRGARIAISGFADSTCCYLAVGGGFSLGPVLASRSTFARGGFGGFGGRNLEAGDALPLRLVEAPPGPDRIAGPIDYGGGPIRVVLGPQDDWFEPASLDCFLAQPYWVTSAADRMGLRLVGPVLQHRHGFNIVSDGIATGAIQVPGNGQPIILLADHQTMGGYPKLGVVASADLPRLGRCRPGRELRFQRIDVAAAEQLRRDQEASFRRLLRSIAPVATAADSARLLGLNLISGVVAAER